MCPSGIQFRSGMRFISVVSSVLFSSIVFSQEIKIEEVKNSIVTLQYSNARSLTFGIKNILEELVQDEGWYLNDKSTNKLEVELVYFGGKRTTASVAVYSKKSNVIEIIAKCKCNGNIVMAKGKAKDVTTSVILLNEQGDFTQTSLSSAIKKMCEQIIKKCKYDQL